ncbi:mitogen-activated protein kinase-binding protein 1 isoform X11 [Bombyx mori]|uniref:mitogen-activated protein kinase-binding protein 1 isoform X11 n=1 Tax=Bombyx mori TaxID=7091 RepID=UPI002ED0533F
MEAGYIPVNVGNGGGNAPPLAVVAPPVNVIRAPGLKRGKMEEAISDRIKLESVLGLTVSSNAALDCDPNTELVAYPAGCTVVLYNVRKNRQSHVLNSSRKSVTCVSFSPDGRYLATGECGHAPAVRVWDLQDPTASGAVQIAEFPGHTHGVSCVAFSTSSKYLVSVGSQHDMIVNVWDWRANLKLASNKVSSRVKAVSFAENGNYFVTVGFRHVKFWYLEYSRNAKFKEPVPLMGRSAILGEQKDNEFCDVVCGRGESADSTYAITRGGLLCEFNSRRLLDKWVELRTQSANCMAVGANFIFVGCAEGIVRCFAPDTLQYITTLPRTHYLGVDVAQGTNISHMFSQPPRARYPDATALAYDERAHRLTCVYNDHSLYVWDVRDIRRVGKSHSALYHSACIWGVEVSGDGTLLTCSSDDTVRMWGLEPRARNIYSNELNKIVYIDPELKFLKDVDLTASSEKDKSKSYDDKTGVRCVAASGDGAHVACGDRAGNVWVVSAGGALLHTLEAHDAEVLALQYAARPRLLASASRDRLVHVFDVDKGYQILQTLDEHSSSITAVRFIASGSGLQMVSCGADKTILFRQLKTDGSRQFARGQNVSGRTTLYDMEVDAGGRHVLTACQDRNVRVYSTANGRHTKTFRGTTAEDGTLIKVALDSSGIYLATSSTDKILSVYDYYSGECMATMYGHSEIVTGLKFTPDCQHLVSGSGDGCIFVWRVPHDMVVTMRARLAQQAIRQGKKVGTVSNGTSGLESEGESQWGSPPREHFAPPRVPDYTLRIGRLPSWAKKSLGDDLAAPESPAPEPPARGKWATRIHPADGSKDSSLDSGTDTRFIEKRKENQSKQVTINISKTSAQDGRVRHHTDDSSLGSFKYEDQESTEHDGDVEDISDGERTSSSERASRPTYYPGNNDDDTPGEFMVNAMDAEELRQSIRRSKRWKTDSPRLEIPPTTTSLSGSGHDSDDDEVSTPSGDNADRNPLSASCESLPRAALRETYVRAAFDSLGGTDAAPGAGHNSLSSQHRAPTVSRNKLLDPEAARKREELNRRILETRRQLENVAFRSNLKSSQSTTDLSYIPEKDNARRSRPMSMAVPSNTRPYGQTKPVAQQPSSQSKSSFVRPPPRYSNKSNMTRSSSVGVLNQSDSESDPQPSRPQSSRAQGLMRPTISSMNKAAANTARRRGLSNAYSAVSLATGGQEESSSEADERRGDEKPSAPRPRSGSVDAQRRIASSSQLCAALTEQLTRTAGKVAQLYASLRRAPAAAADLSGLEAAILETQKVLRSAVSGGEPGGAGGLGDAGPHSLTPAEGDAGVLDVDSTREKLENLVAKEVNATNPAMSLIEQYSDLLLNMMQNKMVNQFSSSPQSLPPSASRGAGRES